MGFPTSRRLSVTIYVTRSDTTELMKFLDTDYGEESEEYTVNGESASLHWDPLRAFRLTGLFSGFGNCFVSLSLSCYVVAVFNQEIGLNWVPHASNVRANLEKNARHTPTTPSQRCIFILNDAEPAPAETKADRQASKKLQASKKMQASKRMAREPSHKPNVDARTSTDALIVVDEHDRSVMLFHMYII